MRSQEIPETRPQGPFQRAAFPLILMLALGAGIVFAAPGASPSPSPSPDALPAAPRVTRIDLKLQLDPTVGVMREDVTLVLDGRGGDTLRFRIDEGLTVEKSSIDRGVVEHRKSGGVLEVTLDPPLDGPRAITFLVTGRPKREGMPLLRSEWAAFGDEDCWYPVFPRVWAETSVTVTVPTGWVAVAPGVRDTSTKPGVWIWRSKQPVRHLAVAAAPELRFTEGSILKVPLNVAAPQGGVDGKIVSERLHDAMAWYAASFGTYPYESFNLVLLPKFPLRMVAAGLVIAPAQVALGNASDGADLLAGQWFGERLAGDGRWMEAFAAWAAVVFARDRALPLPAEIERLRKGYFGLLSGDVALARAGADTPEEVLRGKGSAAPDMVKLVTGDRAFFAAVRELFDGPVRDPLSLAQMRASFERASYRSLQRAFADWFDRAGAPQIDAVMRTMPAAEGGWRVDLTLVQKRAAYALPVEVVFLGPGEEHREIIEVDQETTTPFYILPFEPVRLDLDPGHKIFRWP